MKYILPNLRGSLLICASAALVACADEPASEPVPNVFVIVLDTVRADRISCYGVADGVTPNIDAFAEYADRYASCTATSSWTLPSHASIFTGLFPFEHGSHGFEVDGMIDNVHPLHPDHRTIAEELAGVGYETAGFVANNVYLAPRHGMDQGFQTYELHHEPSPKLLGRARKFLEDRTPESGTPEKPLFMFINLMDAHRPYFVSNERGELVEPSKEKKKEGLLEQLCIQVMVEGKPPGELAERVSARYNRALSSMDQQVGLFLHELRQRDLFDNSIIVITSDHGEAFGTHGIVEHAKDVYEPLVSVPLIVKAPGQEIGAVHQEVASLVDVGGLVARSVPGNAGGILKKSFPRLPGEHPVTAEIHFARPRDIVLYKVQFQHERTALRDGSFKLIVGGDELELFDVRVDPGEQRNLAADEPARVQGMRAELDSFLAKGAYRGERLQPRPLSAEILRKMEVLGYGGSGKPLGKPARKPEAKDAGPR